MADTAKKTVEETKAEEPVTTAEETPVAETSAEGGEEKKEGGEEKKDEKEIPRPAFMAKPDGDKFRAELRDLQDKIESRFTELKSLNNKRSTITDGSKGKFDEKEKEFEVLKGLRDAFHKLLNEKKAIRARIDSVKESATKRREKARADERKDPYSRFSSVEDCNNRIAELEDQLSTSVLSLREEKNVLADISSLRARRSKIEAQEAKKAGPGNPNSNELDDLFAALRSKDTGLNEAKAKMEAQQVIVDKLWAEIKEDRKDLPAVFKRRDEIRKELDELMASRQKLRDDYDAAGKAFGEYLGKMRVWRAQEYKRRDKERKQWDKEKAALREKEDEELVPWQEEMNLCVSLIGYLKNLLPKEEKKAAVDAFASLQIDGAQLIGKKSVEEDVFYKGKKKGKKGKRKNKDKSKQQLTVAVETIEDFGYLKLTPPSTLADVPALIEKVEAKLAEFKVKPPKKKGKKKAEEGEGESKDAAADAAEEKKEEKKEEEKKADA